MPTAASAQSGAPLLLLHGVGVKSRGHTPLPSTEGRDGLAAAACLCLQEWALLCLVVSACVALECCDMHVRSREMAHSRSVLSCIAYQ